MIKIIRIVKNKYIYLRKQKDLTFIIILLYYEHYENNEYYEYYEYFKN